MYHASRPAPPRPTSSPYLPRDHPFSTYYSPLSYGSTTSLSTTTTDSRRITPPSSPGSCLSTYSQASHYRSHSTGDSHKSSSVDGHPTSHRSLAAPLSPRSSLVHRNPIDESPIHLGHYNSTTATIEHSPIYSQPLRDLSILDSRPRQTLLHDLEFIFNKKLRFPLLERFTTSASDAQVEKGGSRDGKIKKLKEKKSMRKLSKSNSKETVSWEDDFEWDGVQLLGQGDGKRYRGVREGNWI